MWTLERWMREWTKQGRATLHRHDHKLAKAKPPGRVMSGTYLLLDTYLAERYADTVVLTFAQIEDVLGFVRAGASAPGVVDGRLARRRHAELLRLMGTCRQNGRAQPPRQDRRVRPDPLRSLDLRVAA